MDFDQCVLGSRSGFNQSFRGSTEGLKNQFTRSTEEQCRVGSSAPDFNLFFIPQEEGLFTWSTLGSQFDTTLTVVDCSSGRALACNDDSGGQLTSFLQVRMKANNPYRVVIDGYSSMRGGEFNLNAYFVMWPPQDQCPGISATAELPKQAMAQHLFTGRIDESQSTSYEICKVGSEVPSASQPHISQVFGSIVETTGEYSFLTCPHTQSALLGFEAKVCGGRGICVYNSTHRLPSLSLSSGDHVSFLTSSMTDVSTAYSVFSTHHVDPNSVSWCNTCRTIIPTTAPTARSFFNPDLEYDPFNDQQFAGSSFFIHFALTGGVRFGVCGALNGQAEIRDCANRLIQARTIGNNPAVDFFDLNVTEANKLYLILVKASSPDDFGDFRITGNENACTEDLDDDGLDVYSIGICFAAEKIVYGIVLAICLTLFLLASSVPFCFRNSEDCFCRSSAFTVLVWSVLGICPFVLALARCHEDTYFTRNIVVVWIAWSAVGSVVIMYHLVLYDWPIAFSKTAFYRADESALRCKVFVSATAVSILFSLTVSGLILIDALDSHENAFTFCAVGNATCPDVSLGSIVQKVFAREEVQRDGNSELVDRRFETQYEYEAILEHVANYTCEGGYIHEVTPLCNDSCGSSNNGECEDFGGLVSCVFGSDCSDCGNRSLIVRRRLIRCNKSSTFSNFWSSTGVQGVVFITFMPMLYALICTGGLFAVMYRCPSPFEDYANEELSSVGSDNPNLVEVDQDVEQGAEQEEIAPVGRDPSSEGIEMVTLDSTNGRE